MSYIVRDATGKVVQVFGPPVSRAVEVFAADAGEMTGYMRSPSENTAAAGNKHLERLATREPLQAANNIIVDADEFIF